MYGSVCGMHRTTIYLPDDLRDQLARAARARGCSEAETVRAALRAFVPDLIPPAPRFPLSASGDPTLAEYVDDAMAGFGET